MRALAALRMVWASAAWMAVEMLATCVSTHACGIILNRAVQHDEYSARLLYLNRHLRVFLPMVFSFYVLSALR